MSSAIPIIELVRSRFQICFLVEKLTPLKFSNQRYGSVSKPCTPVVHIKIAGIYGCSFPYKMVFS